MKIILLTLDGLEVEQQFPDNMWMVTKIQRPISSASPSFKNPHKSCKVKLREYHYMGIKKGQTQVFEEIE